MMQDCTGDIRVTAGALSIPGPMVGQKVEIVLASEDISKIFLYSDIEALAGVGALKSPSQGPGTYPKSQYTQVVYFALELHTRDHGKLILPRIVENGLIDCLCLAELIEDRMGITYELRDDFAGRSYFATTTFVLVTAIILGLIFGG